MEGSSQSKYKVFFSLFSKLEQDFFLSSDKISFSKRLTYISSSDFIRKDMFKLCSKYAFNTKINLRFLQKKRKFLFLTRNIMRLRYFSEKCVVLMKQFIIKIKATAAQNFYRIWEF